MNATTDTSGLSRVEGRSDFQVSLSQTKAPTNVAGRWIFEALIGMAEQFMQAPGTILSEWRAQFECRVNTGRVPIEERKQVVAEYQAHLLSEESAQAQIGIIDVQAEGDRILAQNGGRNFSLLNRQADLLVKFNTAGAAIDGAAELVGFAAGDAKKLLGTDGTGDPAVDPNGNPIVNPADAGGDNPPANPPTKKPDASQGDGNSNAT
jgi:hypothetical protein